jgi:hypothetical protein
MPSLTDLDLLLTLEQLGWRVSRLKENHYAADRGRTTRYGTLHDLVSMSRERPQPETEKGLP